MGMTAAAAAPSSGGGGVVGVVSSSTIFGITATDVSLSSPTRHSPVISPGSVPFDQAHPSSRLRPRLVSVVGFVIGGHTAVVTPDANSSDMIPELMAFYTVDSPVMISSMLTHEWYHYLAFELGSPPLRPAVLFTLHAPIVALPPPVLIAITVITGHITGIATAARGGAGCVDRRRRLGRRSTLANVAVPRPSGEATNPRDHPMRQRAEPGGMLMTESTTTVPTSWHVSGPQVLPRVGTARRILAVVAVASPEPKRVAPIT